jgi:preprotein translocase subunit SecG
MIAALIVLHVLVCIFLIAVVLLQRGKGAEMGAVFGGGASSTVFGSRGAGNFLTLLTKICAAVFMLTSLSLSYLYTEQAGERLFESGVEASQEEPFEDLGSVMPEETGAGAPQVDPMNAAGDDAAPTEPVGQDGKGADGTP